MRQGIHPDYVETKVTCSCGNTFMTRSTKPDLHVELCSSCHPFYTGKQKFVDTGGRVQRFADKFGSSATAVLDRETAERDARRKAHEESALAAREAKAARDAGRAGRAAKHETAEAVESGAAAADVVEPVVEQPVGIEEPVEVVETLEEEETAAEAPVEETPAE